LTNAQEGYMSTTTLPTGTWKLDPTSTVSITVKKLGFITVVGTLDIVSSTIEVDAENQITNVEVVTKAGSYSSSNPKRDTHVHSADFLDVENHETISFTTGAVKPTSSGYQSAGSLTIKGQSSPMEVTITDVDVSENSGSFNASATINRKKIGIDKMPTFVIGQNLQLKVSAKVSKA
jgi:polyisoprenoid-binding protein YceI